nr:hypothetical protein [Salinisphaera halophila]
MAPYRASIADIVESFSGTPERCAILDGLLDFREKMRRAGIDQGFQWIAGSFIENCEKTRERPPKDVDVVTFARRPTQHEMQDDWRKFVANNHEIFSTKQVKEAHDCDAYYVDLSLPSELVVSQSRFWFGLFSHQRATYLWKGILQVSLADDDAAARALLAGGITNAS